MVSDMRVTRYVILIVLMRMLSVVVFSVLAVDEILVLSVLASSDIQTVIVIHLSVLLFI